MTQEQYLQGVESFTPQPDDNPDCIPFYRAWRGMETILGKETMSRWHYILHEAICWGSNKPIEEQYSTIIQHARYMVTRWSKPEEPRYSYSYECMPSEPTDEDGRQFFNSEYKLAFPGKRANSKEANRLWAEKREQAMSILQEQYKAKLDSYLKREGQRQAENLQRREEWVARFWAMAQFEDLLRSLESSR